MQVSATFYIRRYWFKPDTPASVLDTLNIRWGAYNTTNGQLGYGNMPYVDVNYWGESDRALTVMELKYAEWVLAREFISYSVSGDDGL
jgi:hypothetical protein